MELNHHVLENATIERCFDRAGPGGSGDVIENILIEDRYLQQHSPARRVPIKRHISVNTRQAGSTMMRGRRSRCRVGCGSRRAVSRGSLQTTGENRQDCAPSQRPRMARPGAVRENF